MRNMILLPVCLFLTGQVVGQDSLNRPSVKLNQFFVHFYPSPLIAGDISFGLEQLYKKRLSHEFSVSIKSLPTNFYYYNKGYRLDYLIKYNLYNGKIFRFSTNFSIVYRDIYFNNKTIDYYYVQMAQTTIPPKPYITLLEDRQLKEYGFGLGFSLNFKIYKGLYLGGDVVLNKIKNQITYNLKELISGDIRESPYLNSSFPFKYSTDNSQDHSALLLRLKISHFLGKL